MFKVFNNYFNGRTNRREVHIQSETGPLQVISADFDDSAEDWDNLTDLELISKAQEWFYRKFLQGKFVNEAVELTEAKAKEITEIAEKMKKVFADSEAELESLKERSKTVQSGLIELTMTVYDHEDRISILEGGDSVEEGIDPTVEAVDDANLELEGGE